MSNGAPAPTPHQPAGPWGPSTAGNPDTDLSGPRPRRRRRWVWPAATAVALVIGIGIGSSGSSGASGKSSQAAVDQVSQLRDQLTAAEKRATTAEDQAKTVVAQQDARAAQLDARKADLDTREAAITASEKAVAATQIKDGMWTVGKDVEPGTYRTAAEVTSTCYWGIYRTGSNGADIIQNDIVQGGFPSVTLKAGQDFKSDCGVWNKQ